MPHEQSETFEEPEGGARFYYGQGPAKGLRIPLDPTVYSSTQDADAVAGIRSQMFPDFGALATAAAPALPSLESRIAQTERELDTARTTRERAGQEEVAALRRRREALTPVIEQTRQAVSQPMPAAPTAVALQTPPSRGLRAFLAPSEGEAPENTISKLIQGITLLATGFTGLARGDATAALASMRGALQGWQDGDQQRADRHFSDWKAQTDKILAEQNDRHRVWREQFDDKRLSIDQQMQMFRLALEGSGLELAEVQAATKNADEASKWLTQRQIHLDTLQAGRDRLTEMSRLREMQLEGQRDARVQAERRFLEGVAIREQHHQDNMALRSQMLAQKELGAKVPVGELKRFEDNRLARDYIKEMQGLAERINLTKIVGGIRPWLNNIIQTGRLGPFPIAPDAIGALSADERRFLALTQDYADVILRQRSGAAINEAEFKRMLLFIPEQSVTPETLRERLKIADDVGRVREEIMNRTLRAAGYKEIDIGVPQGISGPAGATMLIRRKRPDGTWEYAEGPAGPVPAGWERHGGQ